MSIIISGDNLVPDCSGEYIERGTGDGKTIYNNYYFWIYWSDYFHRWTIECFETGEIWVQMNDSVEGTYYPDTNYPTPMPEGNPIVILEDSSSESSSSSEESTGS